MALSTTLLRILMKCHRLYIHQSIISTVLFSEPHFHWLDEYWSVKGHHSVSNQSCLRNGQLLLTASGQHQRDAPAVHNPYGQYSLWTLQGIVCHIYAYLLYNVSCEREKPFLRHCLRNFFCSIYSLCPSHKDYKCFAEMGFTLIHQVPRPRRL